MHEVEYGLHFSSLFAQHLFYYSSRSSIHIIATMFLKNTIPSPPLSLSFHSVLIKDLDKRVISVRCVSVPLQV